MTQVAIQQGGFGQAAKTFLTSNTGKAVMIAIITLLFFAVSAHAGTTDNLGIKSSYTTIVGWLSDGYVTKIVAVILFVVGVTRAVQGAWLQFFIMLGFAVLISQGQTIVEKLFTGVIPM